MPKKTCELIVDSGNEYVIAVKDNQPKLHQKIQDIAATKQPDSRDISIERTRDRVTQRTVSVFHHNINISPDWKGLKSLIKVERIGTRAGKKYHEIVCYITSLMGTAAEFAVGIRGHWGIENRLHWVKDVLFKEDISRMRTGNASANFSSSRVTRDDVIRAFAINLIRRNGYDSITNYQRFFSHDLDKLLCLVE